LRTRKASSSGTTPGSSRPECAGASARASQVELEKLVHRLRGRREPQLRKDLPGDAGIRAPGNLDARQPVLCAKVLLHNETERLLPCPAAGQQGAIDVEKDEFHGNRIAEGCPQITQISQIN